MAPHMRDHDHINYGQVRKTKTEGIGAAIGYEAELRQRTSAPRGSMEAAEYKHAVLPPTSAVIAGQIAPGDACRDAYFPCLKANFILASPPSITSDRAARVSARAGVGKLCERSRALFLASRGDSDET